MSNEVKNKLAFVNYNVKEVILKENDKFQNLGEPIAIGFDLSHKTITNKNNMKIILKTEIFKNAEENNYPFYMSVTIEGNFKTEGDDIEKFEINGIALLFPYLRAIISTYTANSNMPTLILPPINVGNYYRKHKENEELATN